MSALMKYGQETYAELRRRWLDTLVYEFKRQLVGVALPVEGQARFRFWWLEPDRHRDPDNVSAGGRKLILDALVMVGVLRTDGVKAVARFDGEDFTYGEGSGATVEVFAPGVYQRLRTEHRLPDFEELRKASELGARRQVAAKARATERFNPMMRRGGFTPAGSVRR